MSKTRKTQPPSTATQSEDKPQLDGVLVQVQGERGERALTVQTLGAVTVTEAPTLLRLAARRVEEELGIG